MSAPELRVLSSGVDTLHLSVRGLVRPEVWDELEEARRRAEDGEGEPVELGDTGRRFQVQGHGWRYFGLWLRSPDYELMLGRNGKFPAVVAQLHSAYPHSIGVRSAVGLVESTLREAILAGAVEPMVSRIDLYADVQGWSLTVEDMHRFVSRARGRSGYPAGADDAGERFWMMGRNLTGFGFGKRGGPVYVRIYNKTTEIARRGLSWLPDLWGKERTGEPVWRVEFELRRELLTDHGLRTVGDTLDALQDLWRYVSHEWITYRRPVPDERVRRWPVDPVWEHVQRVHIQPRELGLVRGRIADATEAQLVQGVTGYLSSLAAMHPEWEGLPAALEHIGPILRRYLESRVTTWRAEVARKRARRMEVTGWIGDSVEDRGDAA